MVDAAQIAEFDTEELENQLGESRRELFNLRFQLATGQLDNFTRIGEVRKDVARMLTELRIREIAEAEGLAMDELPGHRAAVRRRQEDEALGRSRTTAAERRAAARAAEEEAEAEQVLADDERADDELAEEIADDDGMARPGDYVEDAEADQGDDVDSDDEGEENS
jgi:large subunit ribosomal protein L29